jgi:hypothetical protein
MRQIFHDVPPDETARILGTTAADVYRFGVDKLGDTVERIGPTRQELHS